MIDWTKPIEDMTGRLLIIDGSDSWDNSRWVRLAETDDPNNKGEWFNDDGTPQSEFGYFEGRIRNRAEPANDELESLRAFKEAAIKRFPELAEPETDEAAAQRFSDQYNDDTLETSYDVALAAIAWARANPR